MVKYPLFVIIFRYKLMLCLKEGRAGRNGQHSAVIVLVPKGSRGDPVLGRIFRGKDHCLRKKITELFTLTNPDGK